MFCLVLCQLDIDYRMDWDDHALRLSIIDRNDDIHSDIVHWIQRFPFPLTNRDYLYVRRYCLDTSVAASPKIIMKCHSITHPDVELDKKNVRVNNYESSMIVQSTTTLDEVGSDGSDEKCSLVSLYFFSERNEIHYDLLRRCQSDDSLINLFLSCPEWYVVVGSKLYTVGTSPRS